MKQDRHILYPERRYFERGANLLKESIEHRRIFFTKDASCGTMDSLMRVRVLPNGRLNLDTIDELVRSSFHILVSSFFNKDYETEE